MTEPRIVTSSSGEIKIHYYSVPTPELLLSGGAYAEKGEVHILGPDVLFPLLLAHEIAHTKQKWSRLWKAAYALLPWYYEVKAWIDACDSMGWKFRMRDFLVISLGRKAE